MATNDSISTLPLPVVRYLGRMLDYSNCGSWRDLAFKFRIVSTDDISALEARKEKTASLLQDPRVRDASVGHLVQALKAIGRMDAVQDFQYALDHQGEFVQRAKEFEPLPSDPLELYKSTEQPIADTLMVNLPRSWMERLGMYLNPRSPQRDWRALAIALRYVNVRDVDRITAEGNSVAALFLDPKLKGLTLGQVWNALAKIKRNDICGV